MLGSFLKELDRMNTKKILFAMLPLIVASVATAQQITTTLNGENVRFMGVQPTMVNGRVLVPLRGIFEKMGAFVTWNAAMRSVHAEDNSGRQVDLRIGENYAKVDGNTVELDAPAMMMQGRTMVPLRFISESMGAQVNWDRYDRNVAITTALADVPTSGGVRAQPIMRTVVIEANTVIPFKLSQQLTSDGSSLGQKFMATIDHDSSETYSGIPAGTVLEGHIDAVRARTSKLPGVISLAFDNLIFPNGKVVPINGSLMSMDSKSVETVDGRMVAKNPSKKSMKYVGIGAGAGVLVSIVTKSNLLTSTAIGAALGYLYDTTQRPAQNNDVTLRQGTSFGVMLNRDHSFRVPAQS
jgi:hypothetical protein